VREHLHGWMGLLVCACVIVCRNDVDNGSADKSVECIHIKIYVCVCVCMRVCMCVLHMCACVHVCKDNSDAGPADKAVEYTHM